MTLPISNGARLSERPIDAGGTPTSQWRNGIQFPPLDLADCPGLVVVAPHPDDEALGMGATIAALSARGVPVDIVVVSSGEAAYPTLSESGGNRLERTRRRESATAAARLGARPPVFLGLPDGGIADLEEPLTERLAALLAARPGAWCAATWRGDGHPDHEAVGRAAATAAARTAARLLEYPVWMWHWAQPGHPAVPWRRARSVVLSAAARERKRLAVQCFQSQLTAPAPGVSPILPAPVVDRLLAVGEVVFW